MHFKLAKLSVVNIKSSTHPYHPHVSILKFFLLLPTGITDLQHSTFRNPLVPTSTTHTFDRRYTVLYSQSFHNDFKWFKVVEDSTSLAKRDIGKRNEVFQFHVLIFSSKILCTYNNNYCTYTLLYSRFSIQLK